MADIAQDAKISPDESAIAGASKLFYHLWAAAWEHGEGTASGDADALHDMRVNLRRLRTALSNFEGTKAEPLLSKKLRREIRDARTEIGTLGDALGAVRDYDVLEDYVRDYASKTLQVEIETLVGLEKLLQTLHLERAAAFGPMVKKLGRAQKTGELRETFGRWSLGIPAAIVAPLSYEDAAHTVLNSRLEEIFAHRDALQESADPEERHELRKSLRRVRYTLETMSVGFSKPIKLFVKRLVAMQDMLGEMQDRTVLSETTQRVFGHKTPADVGEFNAHGAAREVELLAAIRESWEKAHSDGFWGKLRAL